MGNNTPRVGRASQARKPDLWYFDRLPPTARDALANAAFNWAPGNMYNRWKRGQRGYVTGADIAAKVHAADQSVIAKLSNA